MSSHRDRILDQFSQQAIPFSTAAPIRDEKVLTMLVEATGAGPDDTILDVACGPGLVACAFGRVARQVTGIDLTPAMIDRARELAAEHNLRNISFQAGDVLPLPFPAATFSIIVSRFAVHHFPNPGAVLAEMRRVCKPAGGVTIADLSASPDPEKAAAFHRMEILRDPSHARALTLDELRGLFREAGFTPPAEAYWRMKIDVEDLMTRSFPAPGDDAVIRQMFEDAVAGDAMGLDLTREKGRPSAG